MTTIFNFTEFLRKANEASLEEGCQMHNIIEDFIGNMEAPGEN